MASSKRWTESSIPSLAGKVVIVTGANSGLGLDTARALAEHEAKVIMACRNMTKAEEARAGLLRRGNIAEEHLELRQLDLSNLSSVRAFAEGFLAEHDRLDILCNNAGVMALPYAKTADGFEMQIGVNHLGHFALTGLLLELLEATEGSRIVNVSSMAHQMGKIRFADLHGEKKYSKWSAYGQSKLANLLFTYELNKRLQAKGSNVTAVACHPGYSATNLQSAAARQKGSSVGKWFWDTVNAIAAQPSEMGALPTLFACVEDTVVGGDYIGPDGFNEMRGYPTKVKALKKAYDAEVAMKLWSVSQEETGVRYL